AILSAGKTSWLYKTLVEKEKVATSASASNSTGRYPGWFSFQVEVVQGKDPKKAAKLLLEEIARLRENLVSPAKLTREHRQLVAGAIFQRESVHELADTIARGVTNTDLDYLKKYLARVTAVTAADVQRVAKKYFDPATSVTVWSMPKKDEKGAGLGARDGARSSRKLFRAEPKAAAATPVTFSLNNS